ncbi:MAG: stage V sporulation protein AB [Clostridiales bacterium]|jgi:stage V sporulation protein AB|nr:stage V sporulation protein AB [Clostridiales bacterium]
MTVVAAFTAFCGGIMVSGGVFAFIAAIGIVPRLAKRTGTGGYVRIYEEAIIAGGIFGCCTLFLDYRIPAGIIAACAAGAFSGVFFGCLTICLAEILYVLPILQRRAGLKKGLSIAVSSFAVGKLAGSLVYFFAEGFNKF